MAKLIHFINRNHNIPCAYKTSLGAGCGALSDQFEGVQSLHQITTDITSKDSLQIVILDPTNASRLRLCFRRSEVANLNLKMTVDIPPIRPGTQGTDQKLAAANILLMQIDLVGSKTIDDEADASVYLTGRADLGLRNESPSRGSFSGALICGEILACILKACWLHFERKKCIEKLDQNSVDYSGFGLLSVYLIMTA